MRYITYILLLGLTSCGYKYVQIIQTSPTNSNVVKEDDYSFYCHDGDTLSITYLFWNERGVMAFVLENTSDNPIYIDWKKSSFIQGEYKFDYYTERNTTIDIDHQTLALFAANEYAVGAMFASKFGMSIRSVKNERVTFIPPHSKVFKSFHHIMMKGKEFNLEKGGVVQYSDGDKKVPAYVMEATESNSGIRFRNFITYSTTEEMKSENYLDDPFFVSKVVSISEYYCNLDNGINDYYNPKGFYIISKNKSTKDFH